MRIKDGFYLTQIGTDFVVIASTPETKKAFDGMLRLNETGAFLWNKLLGGSTDSDLTAALAEEYGVDGETAAADVCDFLETLRSVGFIEE